MSEWPYPFWFAHRGAGTHAPENTLAAFRLAAEHGFRGYECDVKLSADDVAYLLHDDTLDRTTNAQGPARPWRWEDLSRLDAGRWFSPQFAGEPPASLSSVIAFCAANGSALNLEIKPCPGQARHTGLCIANWLSHHWPCGLRPPLLSSFEPEALEGAASSPTAWPRALLLDDVHPDSLTQAQSLGCVALVVNCQALSVKFITQAHALGLRVLAFTVNTLTQAKRLQSWEIDGLITDEIVQFAPGCLADQGLVCQPPA